MITASESSGSVYTYTYDLEGNRTSVAIKGTTTSYTYNAADQVTNTGWAYTYNQHPPRQGHRQARSARRRQRLFSD